MSSLLWQNSNTRRFCFSTKPGIGNLRAQNIILVELGSYMQIVDKIKSYMYSQTFSRRRILKEPARYAAYFVFMHREVKLEMTHECNFLAELLESVEPNIWVQNRDIVDLLLGSLINYSRRL